MYVKFSVTFIHMLGGEQTKNKTLNQCKDQQLLLPEEYTPVTQVTFTLALAWLALFALTTCVFRGILFFSVLITSAYFNFH